MIIRTLGTVSIEELSQAIWQDIKSVQTNFNVTFVTGAQLILPPTNEFGDQLIIKHPDGRIVRTIASHYYRPACLDYEL